MSEGLRSTVTRGAFWLTLGQGGRQVIAIGTNVALARLLDPDAFGLFAMSLVAAEVAQQFADFGIGSAIVQNKTLNRDAVSTCFWINVSLATLCAIILVALSPWIGTFMRHALVGQLLMLAALNVIISGALTVPQALLVRDMRFREIVTAQIIGSATGATAAITFALLGGGAWSLAVQPLVGTAVTLGLMMAMGRWRPDISFSYASVREMMHFSGNLLGYNVVTLAGRHAHNVIMGRSLASAAVGLYNMAQTVTYFPVYQISAVFSRLLFPTLSRLQDDLPTLRRVYLDAIAIIALCTFPLMAGMFAVAGDFVTIVFGSQWVGIIPVLEVVLWVAMLQSVATSSGTVLLSLGKSRQLFGITVAGAAASVTSILFTVQWGLMGVTWTVTVLGSIAYLYTTYCAVRHMGLTMRDFFAALVRPFGSAMAMMVTVKLFCEIWAAPASAPRLAAAVVVGAASYVGFSWFINRERLQETVRLVRQALGGQR